MIFDRSRRLALWLGRITVLCAFSAQALASTVALGALSYDTFIPGSPGVDAFNVANLTGSFSLPPDFPTVTSVSFQNATLTLKPIGQAPELFSLGDIGPGFLLDSGGNPVVQIPSNQAFASAEFTATLSASMFGLADGTTFAASSPTIEVLLLPSQGLSLTADVDQTTIDVSNVPEPASGYVALLVLPWLLRRRLPR